MVTGRRPSRPAFQDFNWGRSSGRSSGREPLEPLGKLDYSELELRAFRMTQLREPRRRTLEQMVYQAEAGRVAMLALMSNLPPGAVVHMDEVDLTGVAPEDLVRYEERVREWLRSHSRTEGENADRTVGLLRGTET